MVGSTYTANGFEESTLNLALILGLSIPLTVIFIVVVTVIVIKVVRSNTTVAEGDLIKVSSPVEPISPVGNLTGNDFIKADISGNTHQETFT